MGTDISHTCDTCKRSFGHDEVVKARCPSEAPLMETSIGFHTAPSNGQGNWFSRVGVSLGDMCKFCQEDLRIYLRSRYPVYREVSIND